MIKQLKQKFIAIIFSILSLTLLIILSGVFVSTYFRNSTDRYLALDDTLNGNTRTIDRHFWTTKDKEFSNNTFLAEFNLLSQTVHASSSNWIFEDNTLIDMMNLSINSKQQEGILKQYNVAFKKQLTPTSLKVAFVDLTSSQELLRNTAISLLILFILVEFVLITIAYGLAIYLIKPVEKSIQQQKQFVADASHELKNPLTVINANTQILKRHPEDQIYSHLKWIENTETEVNRMSKLVSQLLFLAKSDAQNRENTHEIIDLSDTILGSALVYESVAFESGKQLEINVEPNLKILGNKDLIAMMTAALCDNAVKYCHTKGTITVNLDATGVLRVQNDSDPIPKEDLDHLFDRFYRREESRNREDGGYGLGLSIIQEIVLGHNGKISVDSKNNQTIFIITFPLIH